MQSYTSTTSASTDVISSSEISFPSALPTPERNLSFSSFSYPIRSMCSSSSVTTSLTSSTSTPIDSCYSNVRIMMRVFFVTSSSGSPIFSLRLIVGMTTPRTLITPLI